MIFITRNRFPFQYAKRIAPFSSGLENTLDDIEAAGTFPPECEYLTIADVP